MSDNDNIDDVALINCVKQFRNLYDKNHGDYKNRQSTISAFKNIGEMLGASGKACERRWIVLRSRYGVELSDQEKDPWERQFVKPWRLTKEMKWLKEHMGPKRHGKRKRKNKESGDDESEDNSSEENESEDEDTALSPNRVEPEAFEIVDTKPIIASCPSMPTDVELVTISTPKIEMDDPMDDPIETVFAYPTTDNEADEGQESDDEDIFFGKSIGHALSAIKNKKRKLEIKSQILTVIARYCD